MRICLAICLTVPIYAQSPGDSRVQRVVDQWMKQHPAFSAQPQPVKTLAGVLPQGPAKPCSVPLLEMQAPKDVQFTMQQAAPLKDPADRMAANVPAPSCEAR
ncbi:MAG: hypothetical protein LAO79_11095 [Acidobacteriia bacterium]|nr:hypothetical protein [Terriglobia bacterium]